jgi:hypothetical protein
VYAPALEVAQHRLVVFSGGEIEQLGGVANVLGERAQELYLVGERGPVPEDGLGLRLVVPEVRFTRQLIELADFPLQCRDVKDAPLAHRRAV